MTNVARNYVGYAAVGQYWQRLAAELGTTPLELVETEGLLFFTLLDYDFPAPGQLTANFRAGLSMRVQYDPATLTITSLDLYYEGQLIYDWRGQMTVEEILAEDWPVQIIHGSDSADVLWAEDATAYGNAGDDIFQLAGDVVVYGGAGREDYAIESAHAGDHIRIADYQLGERICFSNYEDFETLARNFRGVTETANGFTLTFAQGPYSGEWSLSIEGVSVEQFVAQGDLQQVLLVGDAGSDAIYAPVLAAWGMI